MCFLLCECDVVFSVGPELYRKEVAFCPGHSAPRACEKPPGIPSFLFYPFPFPQTGLKTSWLGSGLQRSGLA